MFLSKQSQSNRKRRPWVTLSCSEKVENPMTVATKILAVDDSPSMRMLLRIALTEHGYDVAEAEDGVAALDWLKANTPDMIITDINMPRMDGFGLIDAVRSDGRHRDRPILVLS